MPVPSVPLHGINATAAKGGGEGDLGSGISERARLH